MRSEVLPANNPMVEVSKDSYREWIRLPVPNINMSRELVQLMPLRSKVITQVCPTEEKVKWRRLPWNARRSVRTDLVERLGTPKATATLRREPSATKMAWWPQEHVL
mmetsp:Transcript_44970/g.81095  ORF Transcript_44970/g.81095 Transcript_44970/m.81095 type:complete len:107 (-) Transcript_44970:661-981(-)